MRFLLGFVAVALLSGCASPPTINEADKVPDDRMLAFQSKGKGSDAAITVFREGGFASSGCFFAVLVDGKLAARLDTHEKATFYVKPGRRIIGVGPDPQGNPLCSSNSGFRREVATLIESGETQLFRISINTGLDIRPSSY